MITVLKHKDKSYIKDCPQYSKVNGKELPPKEKGGNWYIVEGDVLSITQPHQVGGELIGWRLTEEYSSYESEKFPLELPKHTFGRWDDEDDDPRRKFYEGVYSPESTEDKPLEFVVHPIDGVPRQIPSWCTVQFPACITELPELKHNFPCSISYTSLFGILWGRVKEVVSKSKNLWMDDCLSIQTLTVKRRITIPKGLQKTEKEKYWPSLGSRKQKTRDIVKTEKWIELFQVVGKYDRRGPDVFQTPTLEGKNLAELEQKIEDYIQSFLVYLDDEYLEVCSCCNGVGAIKQKTGI